MSIEVQYFEECPNWRVADERVRRLAAERGLAVSCRVVATPEDAVRFGFRGSPTILIDGRDPFATGDEPVGLACRIYQTPAGPAGSPTLEQLRAAIDGR